MKIFNKILIISLLFVFSSCLKLSKGEDITCKINGNNYVWENWSWRINTPYHLGTYAAVTDSTLQILMHSRKDEYNSEKNYKLYIEIHNFKGEGTYSSNEDVKICRVKDYDDEIKYDSLLNAKIVISKILKDKKITGKFELQLQQKGDSLNLKQLIISNGIFNEMRIKEHKFVGGSYLTME